MRRPGLIGGGNAVRQRAARAFISEADVAHKTRQSWRIHLLRLKRPLLFDVDDFEFFELGHSFSSTVNVHDCERSFEAKTNAS